MNDIEFLFIGWCKTVKKGVHSDKVWTAFKAGGTYYAGWAARGKTIRFKEHDSWASLDKVQRGKMKDYDEVDKFELFAIFPTFEDDVAEQLTFSIMADKVM